MDARLSSASPAAAGLDRAQPNRAGLNGTRLNRATRLTDLRPGTRGRLLAADLESNDLALLHALGLCEQSSFRLCKAGDPWIVQVRGTRIGISQHVAELLQVEPMTESTKAEPIEDLACGCDEGECRATAANVDELIG